MSADPGGISLGVGVSFSDDSDLHSFIKNFDRLLRYQHDLAEAAFKLTGKNEVFAELLVVYDKTRLQVVNVLERVADDLTTEELQVAENEIGTSYLTKELKAIQPILNNQDFTTGQKLGTAETVTHSIKGRASGWISKGYEKVKTFIGRPNASPEDSEKNRQTIDSGFTVLDEAISVVRGFV